MVQQEVLLVVVRVLYSYSWSNGSTSSTATNLSFGTYYVTVTDNDGCTGMGEVSIAPPPSLLVFATATGETTTGANDGTATASAVGGIGVYSFSWSNGGSGTTISNLSPGAYTVTATDGFGCSEEFTIIVDAGIPDSDFDGVPNSADNCPFTANPGQEDSDNDGQGDACSCDPATAPLATLAGIHQSAFASYDGQWTHYCNDSGELLLSLALDNTGAVISDTEVRLEIGNTTTSFYSDLNGFLSSGSGGAFINRNWDVQPTVQPTSNVGVRFYFHQSEYEALNTELAYNNLAPIPNITDLNFFKVTDPSLGMFPPIPSIPLSAIELIANGSNPGINTWAHGSHGGIDHYAEYEVYSFSGGGGGGAESGKSLPVELVSFTAKLINEDAHLHWITASEQNNLGWEIQKFSTDGAWRGIGFVNGQVNSDVENSYSFVEESLVAGNHYYRLKQIDIDGKVSYSNVSSVSIEGADNQPVVYPNPAYNEITLVNGSGRAKIFNSFGILIKTVEISEGHQYIDISELNGGMYFIEFNEGGKQRSVKFFKTVE